MDIQDKKRKNGNKIIFYILIIISMMFMTVAYAQIDAITFNITGEAIAKSQDGIFITDVVYKENTNADTTSSEIVKIYQSMLTSNIVLSDTKENSSITYTITVYNKLDTAYRFTGVTYDSEFYSNKNIIFELSGIKIGDKILSEKYVSFDITFKYIDNLDMTEENFSNVLNSVLDFNFELDAIPVLANKMIPVYNESGQWKKTTSTSDNWHNYYNGQWANALTYNHKLAYNQAENNTELKVFNGTSDYINLGSKNHNFGTNLTIVVRFKIEEYGSEIQILTGNVETTGFYLGLTSGNKIRFRFYQEDGTNKNVHSKEKIELDTWYTTVVTYDGSIVNLYVNGTLEDSLEHTGNITVSAAPLAIGGNPNTNGAITNSYFKGIISEVIYIEEPLTELEVFENYGKVLNHIPDSHNVLYYLKFDGDNGIVCNSASYGTEGMSFNGKDAYISVGYSNYDFNNSFSIGARVKIHEYSNGEYTIFGNPQSAGFNLFKSTDNKLEVAVYDTNTNAYINQETSFTPELDTWYTLMATYDGTELKLYVDGIEHTSIEANIGMKVCTTPFMIGVNANLTSTVKDHFNGMISDAILVDEALTANQISKYYSSNVRNVVSDKTLISYDLRSYEARENGTTIPEEMINTMWVWIPRFKADIPSSLGVIKTKIVGIEDIAHDAFTLGEEELEGFWIGKYENSTNFVSENADNTIFIKPNSNSWTNNSIGSMFNTIKNIALLPEKHGFDANDTNLDSHMIKNNEWAAVAYFAQGRCGISRKGAYIEVEEGGSTTGNAYGVYSLAGGVNEFVMGNYNNMTNSYFDTLPDTKYYNKYTTEEEYTNKNLQHALFETKDIYNISSMDFVDETNMWLIRNNLFSYLNSSGTNNSNIGSRSILVVK